MVSMAIMRIEFAQAYVKSPVASLCLACSSVRKRVRVTMLVLTFSVSCPLEVVAIVSDFGRGVG